ncbi:Hypothetical predicted protein [Pelobates cultripes]|uniref:Uncharacterized protein n=1 Tax=Pelobates cultripes TaxID=61616 RepID=A0AAD1T9V6_PELCU|nr:Hypothetical predicted protein [Pelobates cultripes]
MARVSLLGKTLPSKLFHLRWAMEHDSEVRDFTKLAFRSPLVKEDDLFLRNYIGIPDIQALMALEVDPALLSITGNSVSTDPTDQTFHKMQFKMADAVAPLLLMLDKAEKEGNTQKPSASSLLASKMALLKSSDRADVKAIKRQEDPFQSSKIPFLATRSSFGQNRPYWAAAASREASHPYAFPPPSLLMKVLEKIHRDRVQSLVLLYPVWTLVPLGPLDPSVSQGNQDLIGNDCGLLSGNQRTFAQASAADVDRSPFYQIRSWTSLIHLRCRTRVRVRKIIEEFKEWEVSFLSTSQVSDTIPLALEFLTLKFHSGLVVSTIKTYGSALNFLIPNLLLKFLNSLDNAKIDLK